MTFSMTQTVKIVIEEVRMLSLSIVSWCHQNIIFCQDEDAPPKLTQREIEDMERAEKEAQQRRVKSYYDICKLYNLKTALSTVRMTSPL